jgi:SurA N-terminal domain
VSRTALFTKNSFLFDVAGLAERAVTGQKEKGAKKGVKKGRRVAALGAGLGACVVLAACAPVQAGAAATVGSQRITVSSLDTQVSNLQTAGKPYGSAYTLTTTTAPQAVLSWLIRFAIMNQVAASNGITVTQAQSTAALSSLSSVASQNGYSSASELLVANGVPPQLFPQLGKWEAQQDLFAIKQNGGKEPTSTAEQNAFTTAIDKAQCTASKSLNIKVSPQFGRFDFSTAATAKTGLSVVDAPDTLSQPQGKPTPASTEGLTPAC